MAEAITIVIMGSICGLKNSSQIHQWAASDEISNYLKEKFAIENVPCYYWLLCLLKRIKPHSLNRCFVQWSRTMLPEKLDGLTLSLDGKSNEIPAVQKLLEELDISGCLVVADALNCQKKAAKTIIVGGGNNALSARPVLYYDYHFGELISAEYGQCIFQR